jgi:hypothetical protein
MTLIEERGYQRGRDLLAQLAAFEAEVGGGTIG